MAEPDLPRTIEATIIEGMDYRPSWKVKLESGPTFCFYNELAAVEAWQIAEYQLGHVAVILPVLKS